MTTKMLSDEKESLLLKIPPTVNIEVVEDSEEEDEYDNEEDCARKASILHLRYDYLIIVRYLSIFNIKESE